jgi:hypothetical protein
LSRLERPAEQYQRRAGAALGGAGRGEGQHRVGLPQQRVDSLLEYRPALAGTQSLAVNNAQAPQLAGERILQESAKLFAALLNVQAMQISLGLDPVMSAAQAAQHRVRHARSTKTQLIPDRQLGRWLQAFVQDSLALGTGEAGLGRGRAGTRRRPRWGAQRPRAAHRFAKQLPLLIVGRAQAFLRNRRFSILAGTARESASLRAILALP